MFGLVPGCLVYSAYGDARLLAPKPTNLSFEAAATAPTVFMTVLTAFDGGKGWGPDTRVLVHAGTGGVGLAAINVANSLGCRTVATAGSAFKRMYLRKSGVLTAVDSRNTSFTDPLLIASGSVDVVLNSLTSPGVLQLRWLRLTLL